MPKIKLKSTHRHFRRIGESHEKARHRPNRVHRLNRDCHHANTVQGGHGNRQSGHVSGQLLWHSLSRLSPLPLGRSPYDTIVFPKLLFRSIIVLPPSLSSSTAQFESRGAA